MNESVLIRSDGRYVVNFTVKGQRYQVSSKNYEECLRKMGYKKKGLVGTRPLNTAIRNTQTISSYFDYWFLNYKSKVVKESTANTLLEVYNRYSRDEIGELPIKEVERGTLQMFIESIPTISERKVTLTILKELFLTALNEGVIKINPMALVFLPSSESRRHDQMTKEAKYLTYANELKFIECLKKIKRMY